MDETNWVALIGMFAITCVVLYLVVICIFMPFL
jgi:hypothetical protein